MKNKQKQKKTHVFKIMNEIEKQQTALQENASGLAVAMPSFTHFY